MHGHAELARRSAGPTATTPTTPFTKAPKHGDGEDNNRNGMTDETAPNWYIDCDGDGDTRRTPSALESRADGADGLDRAGRWQLDHAPADWHRRRLRR
ncbi:MAG: hypothetical protein R3B82_09850 [Sandaracinaceae bacterium]